MDKYIKKMREVITNSSEKIIGLEKKRDDYKHFLPEYEKEANDKIDYEIRNIINDSTTEIESIKKEIFNRIDEKCKLNPKDITEDIKLLDHKFNFTKEQLLELIEKYRSNYTMTNAIIEYVASSKNKELDGLEFSLQHEIITKEDKKQCYNDFCNSAINLISNYSLNKNELQKNAYSGFGEDYQISQRYIKILKSCEGY